MHLMSSIKSKRIVKFKVLYFSLSNRPLGQKVICKDAFWTEEGVELKQVYKVKREKEREMLSKELQQQISIK